MSICNRLCKIIGEHNSLSKYIANQLFQRIKNKEVTDIEGGFLSNDYLEEIKFNNSGEIIEATINDDVDFSIFRMKSDCN